VCESTTGIYTTNSKATSANICEICGQQKAALQEACPQMSQIAPRSRIFVDWVLMLDLPQINDDNGDNQYEHCRLPFGREDGKPTIGTA
jgi:hypothetical protein